MVYRFQAVMQRKGEEGMIEIPFNVWEICRKEGEIPVKVKVDNSIFVCNLVPRKNGFYNIPVNSEIAQQFEENKEYDVTFRMMNRSAGDNSPYSTTNPIRKIDSIDLVKQHRDGLCGQSCIAMLAGITLEEAINVMHCSEWQATMGKMIETLNYFGIAHSEEIIYTTGRTVELPRCCVILERMGRYSHYLIHFEGKFYDSTLGILPEYDMSKMLGYFEITG